jgi:argininosuccinate lyase
MIQEKKKPWGGRFREATDSSVEAFTASIHFDCRLYRQDIAGSIAHAGMLGRQGILSAEEEKSIVSGLKGILRDIERGRFIFRDEDEDIHMAVEKALIERIGAPGEKLHTGRSRNDQVSLDMRLYLRDEIKGILKLLAGLNMKLLNLAKQEKTTLIPGYTHLQKAQPVLLAHYFLAFESMFTRDEARMRDCLKRVNVMPLGAAALAGSSLPLDRHYTARLLKVPVITTNSMDTVSDRDFVAEFIFAASLIMMHMSRLCEDLILWSSSEFKYIEIADAFTTGSSIMPQKKNPDVAELIRGKTGRVYGSLVAVLTVLKGLPMTYNRDMQEDKEALFDAVDTVKSCLSILSGMIGHISFDRSRMAEGAAGGFSTATDVAEYLVMKGVAFREAHGIVGRLVGYCLEKKKTLFDLGLREFRQFYKGFDQGVFTVLQPSCSVNAKTTAGGTSEESVTEQIRAIEERRQ